MTARLPDRRRRLAACLLLLAGAAAACSSSARQLMEQAESGWRKGRYYEAIQDYETLYKLERRGRYAARSLLKAGNIYYLNLRQLKQAIEFYDRLTMEFPDSEEAVQARRQLASIYANEVVDLNQAVAQYNQLLEIQDLEDRQELLFQRADIYFKQGDYYHALRELLSLEESGISGHLADQVSLKIGNIYQTQKKFPEAIEFFRKVLSAECPECRRRAALNLAETYENMLNIDKAIEALRILDDTMENRDYIRREVARLEAKRKSVESGIGLDWKYAAAMESGAGSGKAAAADKRGTARRSPAKKKKAD